MNCNESSHFKGSPGKGRQYRLQLLSVCFQQPSKSHKCPVKQTLNYLNPFLYLNSQIYLNLFTLKVFQHLISEEVHSCHSTEHPSPTSLHHFLSAHYKSIFPLLHPLNSSSSPISLFLSFLSLLHHLTLSSHLSTNNLYRKRSLKRQKIFML